MEKVVTLNNSTGKSTPPISVKNNGAVFSIRIDKDWLIKWARRIGIIALVIGYIMIAIVSYGISPVYFWTLVKAGTILGLLSIIALSKK